MSPGRPQTPTQQSVQCHPLRPASTCRQLDDSRPFHPGKDSSSSHPRLTCRLPVFWPAPLPVGPEGLTHASGMLRNHAPSRETHFMAKVAQRWARDHGLHVALHHVPHHPEASRSAKVASKDGAEMAPAWRRQPVRKGAFVQDAAHSLHVRPFQGATSPPGKHGGAQRTMCGSGPTRPHPQGLTWEWGFLPGEFLLPSPETLGSTSRKDISARVHVVRVTVAASQSLWALCANRPAGLERGCHTDPDPQEGITLLLHNGAK